MLFMGSIEQCQNLVEWLNTLMPGVVKFTFEYSTEKVEFLDLEIRIENGRFETNLYVKPTNKQLFLDYFSNHPEHCKKGIAYSQALRVIERCSTSEDTKDNLDKLETKLTERNYPPNLVKSKIQLAEKKNRKEILQKRKPKGTPDNRVRLIFTHNSGNPPVHQWIREAKKLLVRNERAKKMGDSVQIGWKQPKNLQRQVCGLRKGKPNKPPTSENPGCTKCGHCRVSCPILQEGKTFKSTNTQKCYNIKHELNCDSSYVIYLATCQKCHGQYVGKAQTPFKTRHSNHKQEVKKKIGGLGHHYGGQGCGYENLRITLIDQVERGNVEALAETELYWQHQLRCFIENGGGAQCRRKDV